MMVISMLVTAFAPTLIGVIIQAVSWPVTYLLTAVSGAVALFLAGKVKYEQVMAEAGPFDVSGSILLFLSITLITVGVMQAGNTGLT